MDTKLDKDRKAAILRANRILETVGLSIARGEIDGKPVYDLLRVPYVVQEEDLPRVDNLK